MARNEPQTSLEEAKAETPVKTASNKASEYDDNDPVTVIWKSWGTSGMPVNKVTYFDRHMFKGGVGRRIPYRDVKKWQKQGHGIHVLSVDATESDFIRVTGHKPIEDDKLAALLLATPPDKIAALLGPDALDKIAAFHRNNS